MGGEFWSGGFFVNTVSKFGSEDTISKYVRNQGMEKEYKKLHYQQISLLQRNNRQPAALLRSIKYDKMV